MVTLSKPLLILFSILFLKKCLNVLLFLFFYFKIYMLILFSMKHIAKDWFSFGLLLLGFSFALTGAASAETLSDKVFKTHGESVYTQHTTFPKGYQVYRRGLCVDIANDGKCGPVARPQRTYQRSSVSFLRQTPVPYWLRKYGRANSNVHGWENSSYVRYPGVYSRSMSGYRFIRGVKRYEIVQNQVGAPSAKTYLNDSGEEVVHNNYKAKSDPIFSSPGQYLPHHALIYGAANTHLEFDESGVVKYKRFSSY